MASTITWLPPRPVPAEQVELVAARHVLLASTITWLPPRPVPAEQVELVAARHVLLLCLPAVAAEAPIEHAPALPATLGFAAPGVGGGAAVVVVALAGRSVLALADVCRS
eukprot:CAMPEP_0182600128 /NCGR_PEP_ID=MMETSP1324-20130603/90831_1 /TAXON_ID=236786 /ORGANISM="Florenciella sp., Strain RCC1587" /LENGTH=109 /DNA_ID=CAMNT_0024818039 /DNA_START=1017 /DNA_END=1347 /DNA_ORIENTATION=+